MSRKMFVAADVKPDSISALGNEPLFDGSSIFCADADWIIHADEMENMNLM